MCVHAQVHCGISLEFPNHLVCRILAVTSVTLSLITLELISGWLAGWSGEVLLHPLTDQTRFASSYLWCPVLELY